MVSAADITETATRKLDALIVGAGFSGLYQLHYLRKLGLDCKIVERGGEIGGNWATARYRGARVDSHMPLYQLTIENLHQEWIWSKRYPESEEIRKYLQWVVTKLELTRDIELNKNVVGAHFDKKSCRWNVKLKNGEVIDCKYFVLCVGLTSKIHIPAWQGMDKFKGRMHHTAEWPREPIEFDAKRVAVIGTGASGVQCIQELGAVVGHLTVLQRTPNLCLPMHQQILDPEYESRTHQEDAYRAIFRDRYQTFGGFDFDFSNRSGSDDTAEQREAFYESLWAAGGFHFWLGTYKDMLFDRKTNDTAYSFWAKKTRARVRDSRKKDLIAPLLGNQAHNFGTKRPSLEMRYYEVLDQDNVDIIPLKPNPIESFTESGIMMKNGDEHHFDIIILSTGFDAMTGGLFSIDIKGTDGVSIADKWSKGVLTYLGLMTANFPNMFICYGPQEPGASVNAPTMIEYHGNLITNAIAYCEKENKSTMEATSEMKLRGQRTLRNSVT